MNKQAVMGLAEIIGWVIGGIILLLIIFGVIIPLANGNNPLAFLASKYSPPDIKDSSNYGNYFHAEDVDLGDGSVSPANCVLDLTPSNPKHNPAMKYYECAPGDIGFNVALKNTGSRLVNFGVQTKIGMDCNNKGECKSYIDFDGSSSCTIASGTIVYCPTATKYTFTTPGFYIVFPGGSCPSDVCIPQEYLGPKVYAYNSTKYVEILIT